MVLEVVTMNKFLRLGAGRLRACSKSPVAALSGWNNGIGNHRWMSDDAQVKHRNIGISAHIDRYVLDFFFLDSASWY